MTRVALITADAPVSACSNARLRALLPHLEQEFEVQVFVGSDCAATELAGRTVAKAASFAPKNFERVLYFVENVREHAFMLPMIRDFGGVVVLHDWMLGELALAARPTLALTGLMGQLAAWREGGRVAWAAQRRGGTQLMLDSLPLNRSVVRHADAFIVPEGEWKRDILVERNAHTPIAVIPWRRDANPETLAQAAPRFIESLNLLPAHRTNRKSLIRSAIDEADRARETRDTAW
ncbi:MAG: hypothetical protein ACI8QZ_003505 [Chlamydiales bacterium]|jgi:hypothetical protein